MTNTTNTAQTQKGYTQRDMIKHSFLVAPGLAGIVNGAADEMGVSRGLVYFSMPVVAASIPVIQGARLGAHHQSPGLAITCATVGAAWSVGTYTLGYYVGRSIARSLK
jgi:hypothetical protein